MRPPATVIVLASSRAEADRTCLEALVPTLRLRDEVLLVVPDDAPAVRTASRAVRTVWIPADATPAQARNAGLAESAHEHVVLLHVDTLVTPHWLDGLLAALQDERVAACGPRTNLADGPQRLEVVPYDADRRADLQRYARELRSAVRGAVAPTTMLEAVCLAARRSEIERTGGFRDGFGRSDHDVTDMLLRLTADGRPLVLCEGVLVHHRATCEESSSWSQDREHGRAAVVAEHPDAAALLPAPVLLSACMIVKDEEDRLSDCLASLRELVDEVVVYDTGSSDDTVAIAEQAGAVVVRGHWDDDFARARNASLAVCTGEWILHVDADELVEGPLPEVRRDLERRRSEDVVHVRIDNIDDDGNVARSHQAGRLFRRVRAHWQGHLHEQLVARSGEPLRPPVTPTPLSLRHVGYTTEVVQSRNKRERNIRVAQSGVEAGGGRNPRALVNLGRSLAGAGRHDEALDVFRRVRSITREPVHLRYALRYGAEMLIADGQGREALLWIEALRRETESTTVPDYLAGLAHLQLGDPHAALALFEGLGELADEMSTLPSHVLLSRRGLTYLAAGRFSEAADELHVALRDTRAWAPLWGPLVVSCWNGGRSLGHAVELVTDEDLLNVLGHSLHLVPEVADALAEALWLERPADLRLLAFTGKVATRLPLERALEWSARLRAAGLDDCPLVSVAVDSDRDPVERLRAAAVGREVFADERFHHALSAAAADVQPERFVEALSAVDELSPRSLAAVVLGAATTPDRTSCMAGVLRALGAEEQADALLLASA